MFKLNPNKFPGHDGLFSRFFKTAWGILRNKVVSSITQFFHSSFLSSSANSTILTLVPKYPGASRIVDYRPISCLNTLYKVISRILVSLLKSILQDLIVPNQTTFAKDKFLIENTVLASELVNGYHKNKGPNKITLKVDIRRLTLYHGTSSSPAQWRFNSLTCLLAGCKHVSAKQILLWVIMELLVVISKEGGA